MYIDHYTEPEECLGCGVKLDGALDASPDNSGTAPKPGDISLCIYCGCISVYAETGRRHPTDDELKEALQDKNIQKAIAAATFARQQRII